MQVRCPTCDAEFFCLVEQEAPGPLVCPACGARLEGASRSPSPHRPVETCFVCGNREFYLQKDFNRELGFAIVAVSLLATFLVMVLWDHRAGIACLVALAGLDWIAYRKLRDVTVCYLCHAVYRGFPLDPEHGGFDLEREEKYKHLRSQWAKALAKKP